MTLQNETNYPKIMNWFILFIFFLFSSNSFAQKQVVLEKRGSAKTTKFVKGENLTFQLKDDSAWYTSTILNIIQEEGIIVLDNRYIKVDSITALKSFKNRGWSKLLGNQLYIFGVAWTGFTAGDALVKEIKNDGDKADWSMAAIITSSSFVAALVVQRIFKSKTIKIGKKYNLRLLNLDIENHGLD